MKQNYFLRISKIIFLFFLALFYSNLTNAQTTLAAGDLAIIGFNGDNPDQFAFVLLVDIESGTEITFTDSGVKSDDTFRGNEGAVKFTASSNYSAGSIITYTGPQSALPSGDFTEANDGNVGNNDMNLSGSGDQIFAFQGTSSSPTFIFGFQINSNVWQADATASTNSALPSSLTNGVNAVAAGAGSGSGSEYDNSVYDESVISGNKSTILSAITNNTNWDGNNSRISFNFSTYTVASSSTTWIGGTDTDWATASNWDNGVPTSSLDATIPDVTNAPIISASTGAAVKDLTINESDGLTINSGGSLIVSGTSTGNITYNRTLATENWYLVSSPVVGQDIDAFVTTEGLASGTNGSNLGLSDYNNATPGWTYYQNGASGTGSFTSGDGRSIKLASQGDISFTGTINTSDVTLAMTSNSNGFNLVGNPYPSYIAGNENADGTNNILTINSANLTENTLWFWNQSTGSYNQINQASTAFQIAPAQGFFVSATGSVNLSITEAMQSHQGTDSFQRLTTRPEIVLTLSNGTAIRNADIYYIEGTTTGWDNGYDSSIFGGVTNEFAIYTHAVANGNGRNLGIQSLPPNNYENMIIPVGINAEAGTVITIDATTNNFPEGINIYLEDKQDNSFTLLEADSNFSFTPENNLDGIGRFYLHTTSGVLSANDFATNTNINIYTSSNDNLRIAGVQKGTATVRLYNILGKEVLNTSFVGSGVNDINLNAFPVGIYIVKLTTENGTLNRKIIIQ
ncbi:T9SS type A sorting domain-containing protein [Flavobacteriaceae bacterium]|nr:T9SS type A sorting domain-containing protein [Flavobacteriaceae bacterium]